MRFKTRDDFGERSSDHPNNDTYLHSFNIDLLSSTLWAHEDLNLGPLPCQGMNDTPSTSTNAA